MGRLPQFVEDAKRKASASERLCVSVDAAAGEKPTVPSVAVVVGERPTGVVNLPPPRPDPAVTSGAPKKRGRPEKWIPRVITEEDRKMAEAVQQKYGPDLAAAEAFEQKYSSFCALNGLSLGEGLFLAVGQARVMDAAFSSLDTGFSTLLKRKKFGSPRTWEVLTTLGNAHADADPVQPRTFEPTEEIAISLVHELGAIVQSKKSGVISVEAMVMGFLCIVTGARAQTIVRLRISQADLAEDALWVQRRWSKVKHARRQRDTLEYKYEWSMHPPKAVIDWFELQKRERDADEPIFVSPAFQGKKGRGERASATMSSQLRKCKSGSPAITSYVFRDFMDANLREKDLDEKHLERLLEHNEETSRSSYQRTNISRQQSIAAAKKKDTKKAPKKSVKKSVKKVKK